MQLITCEYTTPALFHMMMQFFFKLASNDLLEVEQLKAHSMRITVNVHPV